MTEACPRLLAEIRRRHVILPFDDGPASGVLVGAWGPARRFLGETPDTLSHATLYFVDDGRPGAFSVPDRPWAGAATSDVAALYREGVGGSWPDDPPRQPNRPPEDALTGDPFISLAWGHDLDHVLTTDIGRDACMFRGVMWTPGPVQDATFAEANAKAQARLRDVVESHLAGRMDRGTLDAMAFMGERLPYFSWAALRALLADGPGGRLRAFAEAFPLIAGRGLASAAVVALASEGDMDGARDAALDRGLQGGWVVDAVEAHPGVASAVDGRRRGREFDKALSRIRFFKPGTVPTDPESFAAYVDAHAWSEAVGGFRSAENWFARVSRMRGKWDKAIAACEAQAVQDGVRLDRRTVHDLFVPMTYGFEHDLVKPSLVLASGRDGAKLRFERAMRTERPFRAAEDIAYRGMNVPDRVRLAIGYGQARARIAALGPCPGGDYLLLEASPFQGEWLTGPDGAEIMFTVMGSPMSLNLRDIGLSRAQKDATGTIVLSASTPDGRLGLDYVQKGVECIRRGIEHWRGDEVRARAILAQACGVPDDDGLGNAVLARAGLLDRMRAETDGVRQARWDHLAAMQAAWANALPRRLRKLSPEAFVAAVEAEHDGPGPAHPVNPDVGPGDWPLRLASC